MMITPQARRRITGAVRALDPHSRECWESWAATAAGVPPYNVAEIALTAIKALSEDVRASRQIRGAPPVAHES